MSVPHAKTTPNPFDGERAARAQELALETLQIEADAILAIKARLASGSDHSFSQAIGLLLQCDGRVVVSGIGKSGHIARKISATLASTGTPSFFVHPAEAAHGDLGMVTEQDVFIAISNSGETAELLAIVPIIKRMGAKLIAMTGNPASNLAQLANVHLNVSRRQGSLPAEPGADRQHHRYVGCRRRLGRGAARRPRIQGRRFCALAPRWCIGPPPVDPRTRRNAQR